MPKPLNADRELPKSLFVQGFSLVEISRKTAVNANTLSTWSKRERWTDLRSKTLALVNAPTEKLVAISMAERSARLRENLAENLAQSADLLRETPVKPNLDHIRARVEILEPLARTAKIVHDWASESPVGLVVLGVVEQLDREA